MYITIIFKRTSLKLLGQSKLNFIETWSQCHGIFFMYFHYKSMVDNDMASIDPRGTVGRIYKEEYYTLLHTKYESSGPCGFGEDFF